VSFAVARGEALGIVGPNGAGKSTTLKLLTRILKPTRGRCSISGRVGALIEVAAGFHPDLTGRENIFLQGAIMGMRRGEIAERLDDIIEFAGVNAFVDTPVKRYSSGMNARLGFSIAAHLRPDVLIIDEVLSVGDMAFQRRCVERMETFRREGAAIVFVSHDMASISRLCARSLFLNCEVLASGPTHEVIRQYATASCGTQGKLSGDVEIENARFVGESANAVTKNPGASLTIRVTYRINRRLRDITLGILLHRSTDLLTVYDGNFTLEDLGLTSIAPGTQLTIDFPIRAHLVRGQYHFEFHVYHNATHEFLSRLAPAGLLTIEETRTYAGVADLEVTPLLAGITSCLRVATRCDEGITQSQDCGVTEVR
jgi:lipopolysaccharide transport system ATP-binding protein